MSQLGRRSRRDPGIFPVMLVLTLVAACGGGGDPAPASTPVETPAATQSTATGEAPTPTSPVLTDVSLAEYLGYGGWDFSGPDEATIRRLNEQNRHVEDLTVACMAERGFAYIPEITDYQPDETHGWYETVADFRAVEGYGMFSWVLDADRVEEASPPTPEPVDPNQQYFETLSDAEREAYWLALDGGGGYYESLEEWQEAWAAEHPGEPVPDEMPAQDRDKAGCRVLAEQEVFGKSTEQLALEAQFDPLNDDLRSRIAADSRVVDAHKQWSACMSDRGFSFSSEGEIHDYLFAKRTEFEGGTLTAETPVTTAPAEDQSGEAPDLELARELFREELEIAAADVACSVARDQVLDEVRREYETQFIAEHRDLLDALRAQLLDEEQ